MTLTELRQKRQDGTPVMCMGAYGVVTRVARDGAWADMVWWQGPPNLDGPPPGCPTWSKRSPLNRLAEWEHG